MDLVELKKYVIDRNTELMMDKDVMSQLEEHKGYKIEEIESNFIGYDYDLNQFTIPLVDENNRFTSINRYSAGADKFDWIQDAAFYTEIELPRASSPEYMGKNITSTVVINGSFPSPFLVPKSVTTYCEEAGNFKKCVSCRLKTHVTDNPMEYEFKEREDTSELLSFVDISNTQIDSVLRRFFKVPAYNSCRLVNFEVTDRHHVTILTVSPEIKQDKTDVEYAQRRVYAFVKKEVTNGIHRVWGTVIQDPGTQEAVMIVWKMKETNDVLSRWKITKQIADSLKIFQPKNPGKIESLHIKRKQIHADMVDNITQIYQRDNILQFFDFIALSPLNFKFLGKRIFKGWAEGLVSGDTRTGKTETLRHMVMHYKCGEFLTSGENSTAAGIMAGVQSSGSGSGAWTVNWGALPLNDKKLLVIDEADTLAEQGILGKMSGARSSGLVEITKIKKFVALARTRLIFIANPIGGRVSEYAYGVQTVKELFKEQQDIARLDVAVIANENSVDKEVVNSRHDKKVDHVYTSELCHQLVMYAWKRTEENIQWGKGAEDYILSESMELSKRYSSDIPLVVAAEMRLTLAKFAISAAVRFFSTLKDDPEMLLVRRVHVEYAVDFIKGEYDNPYNGYYDYSMDKIDDMFLDKATCERWCKEWIVVRQFLNTDSLQHKDIEDILGLDRDAARKAAGQLRKAGALKSIHQYYRKTTSFINYLKERKIKLRSKDRV